VAVDDGRDVQVHRRALIPSPRKSALHEFEIAHRRYGFPNDDDDWPGAEPLTDERRVRLEPLIKNSLRRFTYQYDFGNNWQQLIKVEDLVPPESGTPPVVCRAGANACPPEDVGGYPGYAEFLAVLADRIHEEHVQMLSWAGGAFDPTAFDLAEINRRLATIKP
jgi:Plasmid pRiA4b ORF-3-like protein